MHHHAALSCLIMFEPLSPDPTSSFHKKKCLCCLDHVLLLQNAKKPYEAHHVFLQNATAIFMMGEHDQNDTFFK
jgi:hypothetical protein